MNKILIQRRKIMGKGISLIQIIINTIFIGFMVWIHNGMQGFERVFTYPFIGVRNM